MAARKLVLAGAARPSWRGRPAAGQPGGWAA